ncbi:MAG: Integral membrane protein MviN [Candidatus Adlerbacteria bacterium GW2011_GWB1_54_7]|uniref:Integral membrane protein MviN n=1 Tax=Candidatus Adlerbacteria bacterium GW2011_GWB1_54_7 TaxID=1618607 RepID=A0A0G1Y3I2_9BACT|nr:MAG: Integral membrane protein MviN [Candidatus Adlerbacteria bacterium GW2011_GWB1_54_7]
MSPKEAASSGVGLFARLAAPVRGLHQAAYLLALFALLSQILALVRDRLLAGSFGASETLDLYFAAFRLPDLLFASIASLLSLYALMPALSRLESESEGYAASFLRRSLLVFFAAMAAASAVAFVFAPELVALIAPGIAGPHANDVGVGAGEKLVSLTRILLLQPILLGASNIVAALTQFRHRFVLYALSPLLYNLGIIFGLVFLYPALGLTGLGIGVVMGAALHLCVQLPFFAGERGRALPWKKAGGELAGALALSVPRTLTLMGGQFALLVLTALASLAERGSIAVFTFGFNLLGVPLAIIGVSYSVAAFPTLSNLHASGRRTEFLQHISTALRHILFWTIPATVFIIVLRAQLVRVILGSGAFDWDATRLVAASLALFALGILCRRADGAPADFLRRVGRGDRRLRDAPFDALWSESFHARLFGIYFEGSRYPRNRSPDAPARLCARRNFAGGSSALFFRARFCAPAPAAVAAFPAEFQRRRTRRRGLLWSAFADGQTG